MYVVGSRLADQGTKEMLPVIFSLAWPTMLEQLMQLQYNIWTLEW